VVGAGRWNNGYGAVYLLSGSTFTQVITGSQAWSTFGRSIAAGNFDNIGSTDLLVGADSMDNANNDAGAAYLYNGPVPPSNAPVVMEGGVDYAYLGYAVLALNTNGDDYDEAIVGAPGWATSTSNTGGPGVVRIRDAVNGTTELTHSAEPDGFGRALTAGDLDGDGRDDLVASAWVLGEVAVYDTSDWGVIGTGRVPAGTNEMAGSMVVCDVTGDGQDDLVVAGDWTDNGTVWVFHGPLTTLNRPPDATITGTADGPLGAAVDCGDLDDDGFDDLFVGGGHNGTTEDGDGLTGTLARSCDPPENASLDVRDCDDGDALVFEDAPERCNGVDDDCDGIVDEEPSDPRMFWADGDKDGFGDLSDSVTGCTAPEGYVDNAGDCDDSDPDLNPDSVWFADGDGDGYGDPEAEVLSCEVPSGAVDNADDCDDTLDWKHPGAQERCNVEDDDCDGNVDEDALGGWVQRDDMPWAYAQGRVGWTDDWLYVLGGAAHGWPNDERKILKADPETLEWTVAGQMPSFSINHGTHIYDGHIYHFGLYQTARVGEIQTNGDVDFWGAGDVPPTNGENPGVVVLDDRLYVFGARSDTAAFADLNSDGSWGAWTTTTSSPYVLNSSRVSFVYEDRIWVVAQHESAQVQSPVLLVAEADEQGELTWYDLGGTPNRPAGAIRVRDLLIVIAASEDDTSVWATQMTGRSVGTWFQLEDAPGPPGAMFFGGDGVLQVGGDETGYVGGVEVWEMGICQ
jgi:hypothetical protein